jgi:hypothetical protein
MPVHGTSLSKLDAFRRNGFPQPACGFKVEVVDARPRNSYICNETHYDAIRALNNAGPSANLQAVYFVHIPYPAEEDNYEDLANALSDVLVQLTE